MSKVISQIIKDKKTGVLYREEGKMCFASILNFHKFLYFYFYFSLSFFFDNYEIGLLSNLRIGIYRGLKERVGFYVEEKGERVGFDEMDSHSRVSCAGIGDLEAFRYLFVEISDEVFGRWSSAEQG